MRWTVLLLFLAACSAAKGPSAERRYAMAQKNGADDAELCARSKAVRDGYLADNDEAKYRDWKLTSSIDCNAKATSEAIMH